MQNSERCAASGKNLRSAIIGQILIVTVNLLSRRIFMRMLGSEYVGLSGLCGHMLNFLSLLEPGFAAACAFSLYKPLAFGDRILVAQICDYLQKIYRRVAFLTFTVGMALLPVALKFSENSENVEGTGLVWILSVTEMSVSYLYVHRRILPMSDQKGYIVTNFGYIFFILTQAARLFALVKFGSFISYILAGIITGFLEEMLLAKKVEKMYGYIRNVPYPLAKDEKLQINRQVKALLFHKASGIVQGSVDNLAVFAFLGLTGGAIYSNYTMIMGTFLSVVGILTGSVGASVGNLGATEGKKRMERVFSASYFAIFFAASVLSLSLFFSYPVIMNLWMGKDMVLSLFPTALFCTSMFLSALRKPIGVFLDGCGLFERERFKSVIEAAICLVLTLSFAPKLGITGVLLGQICGSLFSFFYEPYILYKYGFSLPFSAFLKENRKYMSAFTGALVLSGVFCFRINAESPNDAITRILLCIFSCFAVFGLLFFDSEKLRQVVKYVKKFLYA